MSKLNLATLKTRITAFPRNPPRGTVWPSNAAVPRKRSWLRNVGHKRCLMCPIPGLFLLLHCTCLPQTNMHQEQNVPSSQTQNTLILGGTNDPAVVSQTHLDLSLSLSSQLQEERFVLGDVHVLLFFDQSTLDLRPLYLVASPKHHILPMDQGTFGMVAWNVPANG